MPLYSYTGRDSSGAEIKGTLEGINENAVAEALITRGVFPVRISLSQGGTSGGKGGIGKFFRKKITPSDLLMFCRQMYSLSKAGIPIMSALHGLADTIENPNLVEVLKKLESDLAGGLPLAAAMSRYPKVFSRLFVSLINVGENTGRLEESFLQIAEYISLEVETKRRIKSALRYPMIVISFVIVALVILNIWVIPVFAKMFSKFGADLPLTTRILIGTSDFFVNYIWIIVLALIAIPAAWIWWTRSEKGSRWWGRVQIRLPVIGSILFRSQLARFARSFSIMIKAGVGLNTALTLVAGAVDNAYLSDKIIGMCAGVERGESLYQTAVDSDMFSPLVLQMMAVGGETGQVDTLLLEVADYYDREVDFELKGLTAKIEPILLIIVAAIVLVLALGIFTPMWDMYGAMQGKKR
ncbi:MAG: type II secretion system F family protein [Succinivibrionaceae bacterium]|nr:type II secretion system F family protein [Succinivibrionaceae bacterium]